RLPLRLEARDDLARIHARLENFQSDFTADGLLLLGHENQAEAAFADLLQQLVRADNYAGSFPDRLLDGGDRAGGRGRFQEATDLRLGAEELLDALAYFGIIAADLVQVGCPVWGRLLPGRKENGFKINGVFGHERGSRSGA